MGNLVLMVWQFMEPSASQMRSLSVARAEGGSVAPTGILTREGPSLPVAPGSAILSDAGITGVSRETACVDNWVVNESGQLMEEAGKDFGLSPQVTAAANEFLKEQLAALKNALAQIHPVPEEGANSDQYRFPALAEQWQALKTGLEDLLVKEGLDPKTAWTVAALIADSRTYHPFSVEQIVEFSRGVSIPDLVRVGWSWRSENMDGPQAYSAMYHGKPLPDDEITRRFKGIIDFEKIIQLNQ